MAQTELIYDNRYNCTTAPGKIDFFRQPIDRHVRSESDCLLRSIRRVAPDVFGLYTQRKFFIRTTQGRGNRFPQCRFGRHDAEWHPYHPYHKVRLYKPGERSGNCGLQMHHLARTRPFHKDRDSPQAGLTAKFHPYASNQLYIQSYNYEFKKNLRLYQPPNNRVSVARSSVNEYGDCRIYSK